MSSPSLTERRRAATLLDISSVAVALFAEQGAQQCTVADIARAAGVSERTFYRYFATKEQVIAPALAAGMRTSQEVLAARPADEPLLDSLRASFEAALLDNERAPHVRRFLAAMLDDDALYAVWLHVVHDAEEGIGAELAARTGLPPGSTDVALTAACVAVAFRITLERWARADPGDTAALNPVRAAEEALQVLVHLPLTA